jgi:hypothetical protein
MLVEAVAVLGQEITQPTQQVGLLQEVVVLEETQVQ